jgi:hypothetical protein
MSAVTRILDRLERVRQTGPDRWLASCPAHPDRSPSLSVRELGDGRILMRCFALCDTEDVLSTIGLTFSDLYPEPLRESKPPVRGGIPARDILEALDHEVLVAISILDEIVANRKANGEQVARLTQAAARIGAARDMVSPMRMSASA